MTGALTVICQGIRGRQVSLWCRAPRHYETGSDQCFDNSVSPRQQPRVRAVVGNSLGL